ncbi:MAG: bifunctional glycosyltransferase family 2/GtrA family protein [Mogibacterium sp.]|nr:bifunctional glycosyltransferase family 2/GtrA family protein [Mogibacterium sp.]
MRDRYIALIPAYEPEQRLVSLAADLKKRGFDIVVVDDGSGSGYAEIFDELAQEATVLTHAQNRGKGAALKTGMRYINKYMAYTETVMTASGADSVSGRDAVIVTVDADGQHLPDDVRRVADISAQKRGALVLGSRALGGDIPARSRFGNTVTRHVYSAATGVHVHDTQTGLRAFHRSLIPRLLEIEGERYEYEINMLMQLAAEGVPIIEERIETVYENNNSGSHFRTLRDSFRVYKEILKFSASSLASFAIDYCMYALLLTVTGAAGMANSLIISNIGARLVSGTANYTMNKKLVFRSRTGFARSALQYALLAAFILAGNTIVLSMLAGTLGMNSFAAKLVTEVIFFAISWTVQKYVIFFREDSDEAGNDAEAGRPAKLGAQER